MEISEERQARRERRKAERADRPKLNLLPILIRGSLGVVGLFLAYYAIKIPAKRPEVQAQADPPKVAVTPAPTIAPSTPPEAATAPSRVFIPSPTPTPTPEPPRQVTEEIPPNGIINDAFGRSGWNVRSCPSLDCEPLAVLLPQWRVYILSPRIFYDAYGEAWIEIEYKYGQNQSLKGFINLAGVQYIDH